MSKSVIQNVEIKKIKISYKDRRSINEEKVKTLSESIRKNDLMHPISVNENFKLIAGLHRLKAFQLLGYEKIKANIYSGLNSLQEKLIEIDENLERHELYWLERADILLEKKKIYDKLYPENLNPVMVIKGKKLKGEEETTYEEVPSFTEDTAEKIGLTQRTVQLDTQAAQNLDEDVKEKLNELNKSDKAIPKLDIVKISKLDDREQRQVLKLIEKEEADDVSEAIKIIHGEKRKKEVDKSNPKGKEDLEIMEKLGIKLELYNIWNFSRRDLGFGQQHFGNQPADMIFNLLYYYTDEKDLVWDVCAGGGVVNDVCENFNRKCYSTDLMPVRKEIKELDITKDTLPDIKPKFIFFDPPYFLQAEGKYSDLANDLANMPLDEFYDNMKKFFNKLYKKYHDFTFAVIISNTQYPFEDKHVEPHALKFYSMLTEIGFEFVHHVVCPYPTEVYNGSQILVAKEKKIFLNLHKDLMIFKCKF